LVQVPVAPEATVPHTCCPDGHAETHAPPAHTSLPGHIELHVPLEQVCPSEHAWPHVPQLALSEASWVHCVPQAE
jgi:hypothetical protein